MDPAHRRAERYYVKLTLGIVAGILLFVAMIWGGRVAYLRWQEQRFANLAAYEVRQGNMAKANLAARTLLQMNPSSITGMRLMADLAEKVRDRGAIDWRGEIVRLRPESTADGIAWARTALLFNEVATAERALAALKGDVSRDAGYHAVLGRLAQAKQQPEKAAAEFGEAVRLDPGEKSYQLDLAILKLSSSAESERAEAKRILETLRADSVHRATATRELIKDGVAHRDDARKVLGLARELQAYPEATWSDRFQYLGFLRQLQDPEFASYLTQLEKEATKSPNDLFTLLSWMSANNLNLLALDYFKSLPPEEKEKWPLPFALADLHARLGDWAALEKETQSANWGAFEFLRHAYLARVYRAKGKDSLVEREWSTAQRDAAGSSEAIALLLRVATEWNWEKERLDLLWTQSKFPEKQAEAFTALYRHYVANGDTSGLYRLTSRMAEARPNDPFLKNNLAQLALLLGLGGKQPHDTAKELYDSDPKNPVFASTYAHSLYVQRKFAAAPKPMAGLDPAQLQKPEIAAYYGVVLAGAGEKEKAREYLQLGKTGHLFPEEKALIERAEAP